MAVVNGDGPVPEEFFPGIRSAGQTAPGSTPSRTAPPDRAVPDSDSGSPGNGAPTPLRKQAIDGRGTSSLQPGQNDLGMLGASEEPGYTDTGADGGHAIIDDAYRFPWQQRPGGR